VNSFPSSFGVYLITDGGFLRSKNTLDSVIVSLVKEFSTIVAVQIRERVIDSGYPPANDEYICGLVEKLKGASRREDFKVIINGDIELSRGSMADGVHLGYKTQSISHARSTEGFEGVIGYSAHSIQELKYVADAGADYALLSPIFQPESKKSERKELGITLLEEACSKVSIPIFALGGVKSEHVTDIIDTGASGVAVISSILFSKNPHRSMEEFQKVLD